VTDSELISIFVFIGGVCFSLIFIALGIPVRFFKQYWMISGYNRASPEEKKKYDIEGLAQHLGNGLLALGFLFLFASIAMYAEQFLLLNIFIGCFVLVSFLMVIGGQKFLPRFLHPPPGKEKFLFQRFIQIIFPDRAFEAMKRGTKNWLIECPCGRKRDYWDVGGIRYKACGKRREFYYCETCQKIRWHKVRRKTLSEITN